MKLLQITNSWPLARKINALLLALTFIAFAVLAVVAFVQIKSEVLAMQRDNLENSTQEIVRNTEWWIEKLSLDIQLHAEDKGLAFAVSNGEASSLSEVMRKIQAKDSVLENVMVVDNQGKIIAAALGASVGIDVKGWQFWNDIQQGQTFSLEKHLNRSPVSGDPVFVIAAPILDASGIRCATLAYAVDMKHYSGKFITARKFGKEGYPYVIDDRGIVIAHPDTGTLLKNVSANNFVIQTLHEPSGVGFIEYDWKGRSKYQAFAKLKSVPWYVCATIYSDDLLATAFTLGKTIVVVSIITAILLGLVMSMVIRKLVVLRLVAFSQCFARGASGDLTTRANEGSGDELGALGKSFDDFMERLADIIKEVRGLSVTVTQSSNNMNNVVASLAATTEEMNAQSSMVASASIQANGSVNNIAESVKTMSQSVAQVACAVEELNASFAEDARNTQRESGFAADAEREVLRTSETMIAMQHSAQEVSKVVEVIQGISSQTRLLALNATIEAATAGEAGKGFTVVAGEVKNLARQSADASNGVGERVGDIRLRSQEAIDAINRVNGIVKEVNEISHHIAASVEEQTVTVQDVAKHVARVSEEAGHVSRSLGESAKGLDEITRNVQGMNVAIKGVNELALTVQENSQDLHKASQSLEQRVKMFTIA